MKVAVDLRRNTWAPEYGISRYGRSLFGALQRYAASTATDLTVRAIDLEGSRLWPAAQQLSVRSGQGMGRRMQQEQLDMRRIGPADADLLHLPWYEGPVVPRVPFVFVLHDLDTLVARATYRWRFRAYYNTLLRVYVRRARRVITTSQASASEIRARWPQLCIDVIPNGVDPIFTADGPGPVDAPGTPYVLYPGGYGPRKRLADLLSAFAVVRRTHPELQLVMTGTPPPELRAQVHAAFPSGGVRFTGYVEDPELAAWYRGATVVAYPSLLEGFGLPIIEGFASGAPVVATAVGSIPEVAGGAARLVPVDDAAALAHALGGLVSSADARAELVALGRERARAFDWSSVAAATVDTYRKALA
ncbi:MAG: glycosyltransferase family 4 protein [Solirubrobacteraceae bacterium]|nr:glycosyltransferase family 4 protein [Solirubrobacteraceae bacterium]